MAELYLCYPSSPLTKECKRLMHTKKPKRETTEPHSSPHLGGNFPTSVVAKKSNTALLHFSIENSSEICRCLHLPAFQPVACPTAFQSVLYWSFHRLLWRKRCSRVWTVLLPPPHHQHLLSSQCPNRFKYVPTGACPDISR
jgi:hypothetical protein